MNQKKVLQWCNERGWTEPRQLNDGLWVAFPPNGFIECPLPENCQQKLYANKNNFKTFVLGFLLIIIACSLGTIAVVISPLFCNKKIRQYRA